MEKNSNSKPYNLEDRTFEFARRSRDFIKQVPRSITNIEYGSQGTRSTGSVAANYIEANEAISKKDCYHRFKICRKEAKESKLWLRLIDVGDNARLIEEQKALINEASELVKIFSSIIEKYNK
ncbi:four helix bundle protein [Candidatus Microgenomates bacterium]|nr:MAG: four helix bundle protein [Candidatus Microgenomates bacterium]